MEEGSYTYRTLAEATEPVLHKDKKSKFYGYAYPIRSEEEVKPLIEELRKKYHTANHVCYAWQLGVEQIRYRANDDGEPNNSAGMPIYGQIQSMELTNVLVAVPRIFGGTKLGVGGLISAYKTTAQLALESATIIEKTLQDRFAISFEYVEMDRVMRFIKQHNLELISQKMEMSCSLIISVDRGASPQIGALLKEMHNIKVDQLD